MPSERRLEATYAHASFAWAPLAVVFHSHWSSCIKLHKFHSHLTMLEILPLFFNSLLNICGFIGTAKKSSLHLSRFPQEQSQLQLQASNLGLPWSFHLLTLLAIFLYIDFATPEFHHIQITGYPILPRHWLTWHRVQERLIFKEIS